MWRTVKLGFNLLVTALVFNYFVTVTVFLLNPHISASAKDFFKVFLQMLMYYGPMCFLMLGILFIIVQFFAERKYPIGIFDPPTITYFLAFDILVISFFLFLNYDYYLEFFTTDTKVTFIKILLINLLLIITGVVFFFFKKIDKKWIQLLFLVILIYNIYHSFNAVIFSTPTSGSAPLMKNRDDIALARENARKIKIVIMDGLSLNLIKNLAAEQKLLNFNELLKKGVNGRVKGFKPNLNYSLINTALTGLTPSGFTLHSNTKYKFPGVKLEFDIRPRYIFFRKSSFLNITSFYNKNVNDYRDDLGRHYSLLRLPSIQYLRPDQVPIYSEKSLRHNNRFLPLFADTLDKKDEKYELLKKAFFFDDFLMNSVRQHWKDDRIYYSVVRFPGLGIVGKYFYQYHNPTIGGNISEADIKRYGWVIEKYYEYYDSIIGNLISTGGEDEMLVVLSLYEYEPLPIWRRILVNIFDQKDIYVYKSLSSRGAVLLYEKNALKKDYPLKEMSIYDIYPTLLYYCGFQLPWELEGDVSREIFTEDFRLNNPVSIRTEKKGLSR